LKIEIIKTPDGQAPEWVRKEWVGIVLPVAEDVPSGLKQTGVLGGQPCIAKGYPVSTEEAIKLLNNKSPKAAGWWQENISPIFMPYLLFGEQSCEVKP
jgi:hypothetical protein